MSDKKIPKLALGSLQYFNPDIKAYNDYYPFGMAMPNRNVEGGYRYGYQGEFAEKEPELGGGINSFEARLWDSRIGRWLTVDPAGEFFSPYLGMGNNPISVVDPDGRCTGCPDNAKQGDTFSHPEFGEMRYDDFLGWNIDGASMLDMVVITSQGSGGFSPMMFAPIPIGPTGSFTTLAEIKSLFTATSGSTMYGNGSDNRMSRKGSGEIYGTWDFNEMVTPFSVGGVGNLKFYLHKANYLNHTLRAGQMGVEAVNQANNIAPIIAPSQTNNVSIITINYRYNLRPHFKADTIYETVNFSGDNVQQKIDSTYKKQELRDNSHPSWLKHLDSLKRNQ